MTLTSNSPVPLDGQPPSAPGPLRKATLYPHAYACYILLASLDIIVTWIILHLGGQELNGIADWIIRRYDRIGIVTYKFLLVVVVVVLCEIVGRRDYRSGLQLARWAVALTAFPVVVGLIHLLNMFVGVAD